jgi:hypothetical protein
MAELLSDGTDPNTAGVAGDRRLAVLSTVPPITTPAIVSPPIFAPPHLVRNLLTTVASVAVPTANNGFFLRSGSRSAIIWAWTPRTVASSEKGLDMAENLVVHMRRIESCPHGFLKSHTLNEVNLGLRSVGESQFGSLWQSDG